ncbi:MAG: hypothetical protein ACREIU_04230 [Planctomycetota bacterium]
MAWENGMNGKQKRILVVAGAALGALWADAFFGLFRTGIQVAKSGGGSFGIEDVRFLALRSSADFSLLLPLAPIVVGLAAAAYWVLRSRDASKRAGESAPSLEAPSAVETWDGRSRFPGAPEGEAPDPKATRRSAGKPIPLAVQANLPVPKAAVPVAQGAGKGAGIARVEGERATGRSFDSPAKPDPLGLLDDPFVAAAAGTPEKKPGAGPEVARGGAEGKARASGRDTKKPRAASRPPDPGTAERPSSSAKPRGVK